MGEDEGGRGREGESSGEVEEGDNKGGGQWEREVGGEGRLM